MAEHDGDIVYVDLEEGRGGVWSEGGGVSNVCNLAHIWSYPIREGEESYISTQRTHSNGSTHH